MKAVLEHPKCGQAVCVLKLCLKDISEGNCRNSASRELQTVVRKNVYRQYP